MLRTAGRVLRWSCFLLVWPAITAYRRRANRSLRWRLTGYNLATLIAGLATALILVGALAAVGANARKYAEEEPADDARAVAQFLVNAGVVRPGQPIAQESLEPVNAMFFGTLPLYREPRPDQFDVRPDRHLLGLSSIAVLAPELQPDGFVRDEKAKQAIENANAGSTDLRANSYLRKFGQSEGVGAYPIIDVSRQQRGIVVIEKRDIQAPRGWAILRAQIRPVVTTVWVGSVVAAIPGLAVAALLAVAAARSVGGRVRDVSLAAESLAEGNLESRVPVRGEDEIASLSRSFNAMAERLRETVSSLEDERARAVALLDANRQLVANASHELRTPVALIRGQVEALDEESPGNPRAEMALRETARLEALVSDLFQLASAEAGAWRMDLRAVDLAQAIPAAVAPLVEPARREAKVTLVIDAPSPVGVTADSGRLERVVQNVIRNAIRHTPEGGLVRVAVNPDGSHGVIAVSDTGDGIAGEDLGHIFERFYRGDVWRSRDTGGAGLGLAIAKELVEAMGGTISVESVWGEGATFTIRLPLASA